MTPEASALLYLLTNGQPHCQVYIANDGSGKWYVTYRGGQAAAAAVRELIASGG